MQSNASTVEEYLASLPPERRHIVETVRSVILANIDSVYSEGMSYGMIGWSVPLSVYPAGYHCNTPQALPFAALASQKNYVSLYMMGCYVGSSDTEETDEVAWFRRAWVGSPGTELEFAL